MTLHLTEPNQFIQTGEKLFSAFYFCQHLCPSKSCQKSKMYGIRNIYIYIYVCVCVCMYVCMYILWREEQTTDTVGVASGLGEAFIQQK